MGTANYLAYIQQQLAMSRENVMTPGYSKFAAIEAIRRNATDAVSREFAVFFTDIHI
jgi:hypothetical protein